MSQRPALPRRGWRWWAWHVVGRHGRAEACLRLAELEKSQWSSAAELHARSSQRLALQLELARSQVPFYSHLPAGAGLDAFPVIDRLTLQREFERLSSPLAAVRKAWTLNSSGSSGVVIKVLRDRQTQAMATACAWRGDCWGEGLDPESRQLSVLSNVGNIIGSRRALSPLGSWLHNRYVLNAMSLDRDSAKELLRRIGQLRPEILSGYPSVLVLLARYGLELDLPRPVLKKILPTAECCSPEDAALMESYFRVPVRQRYGSHEFSTMAHQCEAGSWHWHSEALKVEVLREDGGIAGEGRGSLLCTSLVNQSMPLVRYEIGDQVDLDSPGCDCGRSLPTFGGIEGRAAEYVYCPDGRWISSHAFLAPLRRLPLLQFQLLQEEEGRIRVLVVADRALSTEQRRLILDIYDQIHVGQLQVEIKQVDELQRSPSGKLLRMINRLPRPALR